VKSSSGAFTIREALTWAGALLVASPLVGYVLGSLGVPLPVLQAFGIAAVFVLVLVRVVVRNRS